MKTVYLGYARASTREQKLRGHTCAAQVQEQKEWAERNDIVIDEYFIDDGYSANNIKRPDYLKMVSRIKENKKLPDGTYMIKYKLVIRYSSRLIRDLVLKRSMIKMFKTFNVEVICLDGIAFDGRENVDATFTSDIQTLADEIEVKRIPGRVRASYIEAAKNGNYPMGGVAPKGYERVKNEYYEKGNKIVLTEGSKATGQKLYEMMASNKYSIRKMRIFMNKHQIFDTEWTDSKVYRYFSNPINYGAYKTKYFDSEDPDLAVNEKNLKGWYDGTNRIHTEPQVSKGLWEDAYRAMSNAQKPTKYNYYFKGLVQCNCGNWMVAKSTVKKKRDVYQYYYCPSCRNRINNDKLLNEFLKDYDEIIEEDKKIVIEEIEDRIKKKNKRKELLSSMFDDDEITSEEYLSEFRKVNKELNELNRFLKNSITQRKQAFNTMDYHSRRNLIQNTIKVIKISAADSYGERKIDIVYTKKSEKEEK